MKKLMVLAVVCIVMSLLQAGVAQTKGVGQSGYVYGLGAEGLYAPSLPGPGFYIKDYNFYQASTTLKNSDGKDIPVGLNVGTFAVLPRFIYIPQKTFWGKSNFLLSLTTGATNIDLRETAVDYRAKGTHLIDPIVSVALGWHGKNYDLIAGSDNHIPVGAVGAAKPGNDEWTVIPSVGVTYYFDKKRKTNAYVLPRYEIHSAKRHSDVRMGDDFHVEFGAAHSVNPRMQIGPVGYAEWKVTQDSGKDITWDRTVKNHVVGLGPEVIMLLPSGLIVQMRGIAEFGAHGQVQSNSVHLDFTKKINVDAKK